MDKKEKQLEEIKKAVELNYCFTAENWKGKKTRDPQEDERWLLSLLAEQDREIARLRARVERYRDTLKWIAKDDSDFSHDDAVAAASAALEDEATRGSLHAH